MHKTESRPFWDAITCKTDRPTSCRQFWLLWPVLTIANVVVTSVIGILAISGLASNREEAMAVGGVISFIMLIVGLYVGGTLIYRRMLSAGVPAQFLTNMWVLGTICAWLVQWTTPDFALASLVVILPCCWIPVLVALFRPDTTGMYDQVSI